MLITEDIIKRYGAIELPHWNTFGKLIILVNKETGIVYTETGLIGISIINNNEGELIQRAVSYFPAIKDTDQLGALYLSLTGTELIITP